MQSQSANALVNAGFLKKEDIYKKLNFNVAQQAAFELYINYIRDKAYQDGHAAGKAEVQIGIKAALGLIPSEECS